MPDERIQLKNLKNLISKSKKKMPKLQELWYYLDVDTNDEVLFKILDLIEHDIDNINLNSDYKEFQYLSNCFKYFNYSKSRAKFDSENIHYDVYLRLKSISDKIDQKLENKGRIANYNKYTKTKSQLISFINNTESFRKKWVSKLTITPEEHNEIIKNMAEHILFEIKDITISKNLLKNISDVRDIRYAGNKTILAKVFAGYMNGLKSSNDLEVVYYEELFKNYFKKGLSKDELKDVKEHAVQVDAFVEYSKYKSNFVMNVVGEHLKFIESYLRNDKKVAKFYNPNSVSVYDNTIGYEELKSMKYDVSKYEDMRDKYTFTIDSPTCKRKEDAVSISKYNENGYELNVYISDIAELINNDKDIYDRVVSMIVGEERKYKHLFSKRFLNEYISLNEGEDRFTIAFCFKINKDLEVVDFDIKHALINIDKNYFDDTIESDLKRQEIDDQMNPRMLINLVAAMRYKNDSNSNEVCLCKKKLIDKMGYYPNANTRVIGDLSCLVNSNVAKFFHEKDLPIIYKSGAYDEPKKISEYLNELNLNKKEMEILKEDLCKTTYKEKLTVMADENIKFEYEPYPPVTNPIRDDVSFLNQVLIKEFVLDNNIDYDNLLTSEELYQLKKKHSATIPYICHYIDQKRKIAKVKTLAKK